MALAAATASSPIVWDYYAPTKPLSEFVDVFWYWRGHEVACSKERILPMANAELVIQLGTGRTQGAGISGPRSEAMVIERTSQDELLGIHFKSGGLFPFLTAPVAELHGLIVS